MSDYLLVLDSIDPNVFHGLHFDGLAGYDPGGSWPDADDERRLYPDLAKRGRILDYAVHVDNDGTAADCEVGDMTVDQCVDIWLPRQIKRGVHRPGIYANLSRWLNEGLLSRLERYGDKIRRIVAHYTYQAGIDSAIQKWCDMQQWSDRYAGRNIDANSAKLNFFDTAPVPHPVHDPHYGYFLNEKLRTPWGDLSERGVVERYDEARKHGTVANNHQVHQYAAQCAFFQKRVNCQAVYSDPQPNGKPNWKFDHRGSRFVLLGRRSHGVRLV
jgi:hypothetical protein